MTRLSIDELRALRVQIGALSPAPWRLEEDPYGDEIWLGGAEQYMRTIVGADGYTSGGDGQHGPSKATGEAIVALRNAAEALIAELIERREADSPLMRWDPGPPRKKE